MSLWLITDADQHLHQPEEEQEPVVLDRLGQEHLDQLEVDQPVAEAADQQVVVDLVLEVEQAERRQRQDVGQVARQAPAAGSGRP